MDYSLYDEIADIRNVLANWENGLYRFVVRANCKGFRGLPNDLLVRCSISDVVNAYRRRLKMLLKEAK